MILYPAISRKTSGWNGLAHSREAESLPAPCQEAV